VLEGAHAPDGATAGTAVFGTSVGECKGTGVGSGVNGGVGAGVNGGVGAGVGERVTAQTHVSSEMDRTMKGRCEYPSSTLECP
jgi:hypothetical protein